MKMFNNTGVKEENLKLPQKKKKMSTQITHKVMGIRMASDFSTAALKLEDNTAIPSKFF